MKINQIEEEHLDSSDNMVRGVNVAYDIAKQDRTLFEVISLHYLKELEKSAIYELSDFAVGFIKASSKMSLEKGDLSEDQAQKLDGLLSQANKRLSKDLELIAEQELRMENQESTKKDSQITEDISLKPQRETNKGQGQNRGFLRDEPNQSRGYEM